MGWILLGLAGALEILFTSMMRQTDGFTRPWPTAATIVIAAASLFCVARATETIPLGTAYAIWGGIGAAGTVLVGVLLFNEPVTALRAGFLTLLIGSIMGLKLVSES